MSFRCDLCDENFTSKFNLKRHNKTYHVSETEAKPVVIKLFSRSRGKRASPKGQVQTINDLQKIREGFKTDRTQEYNFECYEKVCEEDGSVDTKSRLKVV